MIDVTRPLCPGCHAGAEVHKGFWCCPVHTCRFELVPIRAIRPDENPDPQGRPA